MKKCEHGVLHWLDHCAICSKKYPPFKIYDITPNTKPRMTQRDKWKVRPCVAKYRAFKDEVRLRRVELPEAYHVIFVMPMPSSWSKKKRAAMDGQPHKQTPDRDNIEKALLDSLYSDDSHVWDGRTTKVWGRAGQIIVMEIEPFDFFLTEING